MAVSGRIYEILYGTDEGRVCRDIPEEACDEQPRNALIHTVALAATKCADGLSDPKLVLTWLLGALGAPGWTLGLLVPVREAGALLPQLFTAASIRARPRRKGVWAFGSLVQGLCVLAMAFVAFTLDGVEAGVAIVGLLALLALARSACSVSYKDVLGKTVSKGRRGTVTATAGTVAAVVVLAFGILLGTGLVPITVTTIAIALGTAGVLWIGAAILFTGLAEAEGATEGGGNAFTVVREQLSLLWTDRQLRRFILTRGLLVSTALSPPFVLSLAGREGSGGLGDLGLFVIASSLASIASTYVWGRLSDRSSRKVLALSGLVGGVPLALAAVPGVVGSAWAAVWLLPVLLFVVEVSHQGVRLGRSTHIVDMANEETRAAYTALSNTLIGVLLMFGGIFGVVADWAGTETVLALMALMAFAAVPAALALDEVQQA